MEYEPGDEAEGLRMTARQYVTAIRQIIESDIAPEEAEKRIEELKRQRYQTLKEFAFANQVDYRTVRRWIKRGKVRVVDTVQGKRIMSSSVLSTEATTT